VNGVLAALIKRQRTGKGGYVEVPMYEAMVSFNFIEHQYGAIFDPPISEYGYPRMLSPFRRPHKTSDGHLCFLAYTDKQWTSFWKLTSRPELGVDPRYKTMKARSKYISQIYEEVSNELVKRTTSEWLNLFNKNDIPAGPVRTLSEIRKDPHLNEVGFFRPFNHETEGQMELPDTPYRFDHQSLPIRHGQPRLGGATEEILSEAGVNQNTIKQIMADQEEAVSCK